jgi:hypothetical protein
MVQQIVAFHVHRHLRSLMDRTATAY